MTKSRQPQTCSHPNYAQILTGVHQVVRLLFFMYLYPPESDSLFLSTPSRTRWTLCFTAQVLKVCRIPGPTACKLETSAI